jgi:hypothetical protein
MTSLLFHYQTKTKFKKISWDRAPVQPEQVRVFRFEEKIIAIRARSFALITFSRFLIISLLFDYQTI